LPFPAQCLCLWWRSWDVPDPLKMLSGLAVDLSPLKSFTSLASFYAFDAEEAAQGESLQVTKPFLVPSIVMRLQFIPSP